MILMYWLIEQKPIPSLTVVRIGVGGDGAGGGVVVSTKDDIKQMLLEGLTLLFT